jgi:hypothetical protein
LPFCKKGALFDSRTPYEHDNSSKVDNDRPESIAIGTVPSQMTAMPAHRFRVGQTVVVPWSGPEGALPLGPYVIVRLLPLEDGEPHYRVRSSVDGMSGRSWKVRSGHGRRDRRWR